MDAESRFMDSDTIKPSAGRSGYIAKSMCGSRAIVLTLITNRNSN